MQNWFFSRPSLDDVLSPDEALHILSLSQKAGCPLLPCQNSARGCPVKSYPRIIGFHKDFCQFPEIRKLTVKNKLNLLGAAKSKFKSFCSSFEKSRKVLFLYKMTKDCSSVKIVAQNYSKENSFTLTLYDKRDRHIFKINDITGMKIHVVPAKVFAEVGNSVKYKIQIS